MDESLKKQDTETQWYVNYKPIKEYLNRELAKKPTEKDQITLKENFSWLRDLKKPAPHR